MTLLSSILTTFLTILVESFVAFFSGYKDRKVFICVILVNIITHPLFCFFLYTNSLTGWFDLNNFSIILIELLIVLVEFGLLLFVFRGDWKKWFALSFLMNLVSCLIGFIVF